MADYTKFQGAGYYTFRHWNETHELPAVDFVVKVFDRQGWEDYSRYGGDRTSYYESHNERLSPWIETEEQFERWLEEHGYKLWHAREIESAHGFSVGQRVNVLSHSATATYRYPATVVRIVENMMPGLPGGEEKNIYIKYDHRLWDESLVRLGDLEAAL